MLPIPVSVRLDAVRDVDDAVTSFADHLTQMAQQHRIEGAQQFDRFVDVVVGIRELVLSIKSLRRSP